VGIPGVISMGMDVVPIVGNELRNCQVEDCKEVIWILNTTEEVNGNGCKYGRSDSEGPVGLT
jgi:hypothetical protein